MYMNRSHWLIFILKRIAKNCYPSIYFTLLNLEESVRFGMAKKRDSSIQENPNKVSEPEMIKLK